MGLQAWVVSAALLMAGPLGAQVRPIPAAEAPLAAPAQSGGLVHPLPALEAFNARAVELLQLRGQPLIATSEPQEAYWPDITQIQGVPAHVRLLDAKESAETVFRHFSGPPTIETILNHNTLRSGLTPYVQGAANRAWKVYSDLAGIFLTLPGVEPEAVGISKKKAAYVDVRLPEGTPVLEIEPGKILLIPSPVPGLELPVEITAHRKTAQ